MKYATCYNLSGKCDTQQQFNYPFHAFSLRVQNRIKGGQGGTMGTIGCQFNPQRRTRRYRHICGLASCAGLRATCVCQIAAQPSPTIFCLHYPLPMHRSRMFMLILAALLVAQSAFGAALHRCHDGATQTTQHAAVMMEMTNGTMHCHDAATDSSTHSAAHAGDHNAAQHGICTCAIAHCAPGLTSHFELASAPLHPVSMPLYRFIVLTAPTETLLR